MRLKHFPACIPVDPLRILPTDDDGRLPRCTAVNAFSTGVEPLDGPLAARMPIHAPGDTPGTPPPLAARQPPMARQA